MTRNRKRASSSRDNRQRKRVVSHSQQGQYSPHNRVVSRPSASKAFSVLARMRRTGESLHEASRSKFTYPKDVIRNLRAAARREGLPNPLRKVKGEWIASSSDKLSRSKLLLTENGYIRLTVKGSKQAAELSRYNTVIARLVNPEKYATRLGVTKEEVFQQAFDDLQEFEGKRISDKKYLTDPDLVFCLADADVIKVEELGSDQIARGGRR